VVGCLVAAYAATYSFLIHAYSAIPYWDQTNYVFKTYRIAAAWTASGGSWANRLHRLDPALYLGAFPELRPPLPNLLPALLWGGKATAHQMAYVWLFLRVAFLVSGFWVLARVLRATRWLPLAAALVLASQPFLKLDQNLYTVDVPFAACGLLAVACAARAMQRRTAGALLLACSSALALLLIKPQALAFIGPFLAFVCVERLAHEGRTWTSSTDRRARILELARWSIVLVVFLAAIVYLRSSPYGAAAAAQYGMALKGYWFHDPDWTYLWITLAGLLPPVVAAVVVAAAVRWRVLARRRPQLPSTERGPRVEPSLLLFASFGVLSWLLFHLRFAGVFDTRLVWAISPVVACAAAIFLARFRILGRVVTAIAVAWFLFALSVTAGALPLRELPSPGSVLGPRIVRQKRHADVGIAAMTARTDRAIRAIRPDDRSVDVEVLACDEFVQAESFNLAARWANRDRPSSIVYLEEPWGDGGFDISEAFDARNHAWFLTKSVRPTTTLDPSTFVDMRIIEILIRHPYSPIHALFEKCAELPIQQPVLAETPIVPSPREDELLSSSLALWHLRRPLSAQEYRDSIAFVLKRYEGRSGHAAMALQLSRLDEVIARGPEIQRIAEGEIPGPKESAARAIRFEGNLVLAASRLTRTPDGGARLDLYWQAQRDMDLTLLRRVESIRDGGSVLRRYDADFDRWHGFVVSGTCWIDTVELDAAALAGASSLGIEIVGPDDRSARITSPAPTSTDAESSRLILALDSGTPHAEDPR
jgi:hypothetical protein